MEGEHGERASSTLSSASQHHVASASRIDAQGQGDPSGSGADCVDVSLDLDGVDRPTPFHIATGNGVSVEGVWEWNDVEHGNLRRELPVTDKWLDSRKERGKASQKLLSATPEVLQQDCSDGDAPDYGPAIGQEGRRFTDYLNECKRQKVLSRVHQPRPFTEQMIGNMANYGSRDDGTLYAMNFDGKLRTEFVVRQKKLTDLTNMKSHKRLHRADVSHNRLESILPLSEMDGLEYLDASHNELLSLEDFKMSPTTNTLGFMNLSHNKLSSFPKYGLPLLQVLDLSNNDLTTFPVLEDAACLRTLFLQNNHLESIEPFNAPLLEELNLEGNCIKRIENLSHSKHLRLLELSDNPLTILNGIENCVFLEQLHARNTDLVDIRQIETLLLLPNMWEVDLTGSQICALEQYRSRILGLPWKSKLDVLDGKTVTSTEVIEARLVHNPPLEVWAIRRFIQLKGKRYLHNLSQPSNITMPAKDTSYPLLILVGPPGSGKKILCRRLVDDFPEYFSLGISHTTRPMREGSDKQEYYFVEEGVFSVMTGKGEFIEIADLWGDHYGLSLAEVERNASKGLATVTHMELDGALQVKDSYFNPRLVMAVPQSETVHEERMWQRSCYRTRQIQHAVQRAKTVVEYHNAHPATFDIGIYTNSLDRAYQKLRNLVQDYLGLPFDAMSSRSDTGATSASAGDDTTVMSSVLGSTSTLDTSPSRRTTPASGLGTGTQSSLLSTLSPQPQQKHLLRLSQPSSRGSFTNLDKSTTMLLQEEQLQPATHRDT